MRKSLFKTFTRGAGLVTLLFIFVSTCSAQNSPTVLKVEPPNWWAGHSINPVRVLIRGRNLTGARVAAVGDGLTTGLTRVNAAGTYVFVDVVIDPQARPGRRALRLTTSGGVADAPFEISQPLARAGRFQGFSPDDVIYLIMPDRFSDGDPNNNDPPQSRGLYDRAHKFRYHGGDLQGVINRLPYLKDLGVTAIWLTPWYDNVNHPDEIEKKEGGTTTGFHGYGAIDFYGVEEHFGTLAKLRELVDEAHKQGIKLIQDQVANHTGPYHPWVEDSPTPTWYNGTKENHLANVFQTWVLHDPRAEEKSRRETMEGWFLNFLPDLNQHDEEVERYLIQNTLWWIGVTGLDGIRQDTWQYVPNSFWHKWTAAIKHEYPDFRVVGEVKDGDQVHVAFFQGGEARFDGFDSGLDTLLDFPLFYQIRHAFAEGKNLDEVPKALAKDYIYENPEILVTLLGGHDDKRFMSEPNATVTGLKLAHTLLLTTRGIPQLYYGDEIAMAGVDEPAARQDFPGGFPGDRRNAFTKAGRTAEEQDLFEHVRKMNRLHAELEPLRRGALVNLHVAPQQYAYARTTRGAAVVVVINNDTKPATFDLDTARANLEDGARLTDRLEVSQNVRVADGRIKLTLPQKSASVLTVR